MKGRNKFRDGKKYAWGGAIGEQQRARVSSLHVLSAGFEFFAKG